MLETKHSLFLILLIVILQYDHIEYDYAVQFIIIDTELILGRIQNGLIIMIEPSNTTNFRYNNMM